MRYLRAIITGGIVVVVSFAFARIMALMAYPYDWTEMKSVGMHMRYSWIGVMRDYFTMQAFLATVILLTVIYIAWYLAMRQLYFSKNKRK